MALFTEKRCLTGVVPLGLTNSLLLVFDMQIIVIGLKNLAMVHLPHLIPELTIQLGIFKRLTVLVNLIGI